MNQLTILLTLRNREVYTENWLKYNIFPEFSYLIADGSDCDRNRQICLPYISQNVSYIQYPPDSTYRLYLQKRIDALSRIKTRFVLYADNDDFLLREGLNEIMTVLNQSPNITLIQGKIGQVEVNKDGLYRRAADWRYFLGDYSDNLVSLKSCLSNYFSLWYSISAVELQKKIFSYIYQSGTTSPYLVEEFQTFFSLAMADIRAVPSYYYVRLSNPVNSNHLVSFARHRFEQVLDIDYYNSFSLLIHHLAYYYREWVDENSLYALVRGYQISKLECMPVSQRVKLKFSLVQKFRDLLAILLIEKRVSSSDISLLFSQD